MSFLNPFAFYLSALAGVIIAVYFLRRRPHTYRVSAAFLWQKAEERPKLMKLMRSPVGLLLLQLLVLSLLVSGLANPVYYSQTGQTERLAILIDGSASMRAATEGVTRYERATERAIALINQNLKAQVTVIQAQAESKVLAPLTTDRTELIAELRSAQPTFQGDAKLSNLIQLLRSQGDISEFDRIVYLTDRLIEDNLLADLPIELVSVGDEETNLGITSFAVRSEPEGGLGYSILVRVENYSDRKERTKLSIRADDLLIISREITIEAQGKGTYLFPYQGLGPTRFTAAIEAADDFIWDDTRYFAFANRVERDILWLGERNRFLEQAITAIGGFKLSYADELAELDQLLNCTKCLIVANNAEVQSSITGNILLVNSSYPPLIEFSGERDGKVLQVLKSGHPILSNVEVSNLLISRVHLAQIPERGEVLISSGEAPVLYLGHLDSMRLLFLGFDLRDSNLMLIVDFPILVRNALAWLLPGASEPAEEIEVGQPISLAGLNHKGLKIRDPEGRHHNLGVTEEVFLRTDLPGFYQVDHGEATLYFAVNLPATESWLNRRAVRSENGEGIKVWTEMSSLGKRPLWRYLVLGGLLALLLEIYYYERPLSLRGLAR